MFLQVREEFPEVAFDGLAACAKFAADGLGDLRLGAALFQEFENSRTDKVETEHLSVEDIEDDGAVGVVGRADLFGELQHVRTPRLGFER